MPVETLTKMEATNADVRVIRHGEVDEPEVMSVPERREGSYPVYVRRMYEPVERIDLPRPMEGAEISEWIEENQDHPGLDDVDIERWRDRSLLRNIVENRRNYVEFLASIHEDLDSIPTNDTAAKKGIVSVKQRVEEAMSRYTVEVDRVEE